MNFSAYPRTCWDSFEPKKRKTNLIGTLVLLKLNKKSLERRALEICSPEKCLCKVNKIKIILLQNGHQEQVITYGLRRKIQIFKHPSD